MISPEDVDIMKFMQQPDLPFMFKGSDSRRTLEARWLILVRKVLPDMAKCCDWPIALDHCFMRVCLDISLGGTWTDIVKRPAIRHLSDGQLFDAITVAEGLVRAPETLHALNQRSIHWRQNRKLPE